ncbi:BMP family lipoprotein [Varunaivibrio sulfuroxidans]|uniref:Nucleoside-binding protein n=1 Tax=Varunaivibrio sulfuroxidans TaxID=1773489 RepID=A0A4R3JDZ2_9PROT|nr:BMP family ABC transporter substrate-binding protein [Varunaivibrio sulfuroxidans]TCS63977.1 nucleoside-binding protein [Varunaivibrio sulfuroxidans]WES31570.1 BMP family ABC transporter substrate-binding protein [Varunaivibrio sulfuroxidans]
MKALIRLAGAAIVSLSAFSASAAEIKPAVVFDMGGKFDKSFNQSVYDGVERFKKETGIGYRDFVVTNETQREQAIRKMAQRGRSPIIAVGFSQAPAVAVVAKEYPKLKFTLIDGVVKLPNVQSVVFKEHEGSFLVGVLAAMASKTGKIGYIGGMDIPMIRAFGCGYAQGAKYARPDIQVIQNMTGSTPSAWNDPGRGTELAKGQFDRGVDVVYAAAGATGIGVYQAAADAGKLAIGVDSNQNYLHPGTMLTSMVKRVDVAAYNSLKTAMDGDWKAGVQAMGLKDGGVSWAYDKYNKSLITPAMKAKVDQAEADIIAGKIKVHDYRTDNACPN